MARLSVHYWRDIPVRVSAQAGRTRHEVELPKRFQRSVEQAGGWQSAAQTLGWWVSDRRCTDDLELEVTTELCRLESVYSRQKLTRLTQSNGFDDYQRNRLHVVKTAS
jgi:hypothetical protein